MPPRHNYWTIIFGGQPTAFRTATREELLPTFKQIQAKHPDALMKWFARGKLWASEEEEHEALRARRPPPRRDFDRPGQAKSFRSGGRPPGAPSGPSGPPSRPPGDGEAPRQKDRWRDRPVPPRGGDDRRGRDWRPGGEHKDPRDRFKVPRDVKRARFKAKQRRDRPAGGAPPPSGGGGKPPARGRGKR